MVVGNLFCNCMTLVVVGLVGLFFMSDWFGNGDFMFFRVHHSGIAPLSYFFIFFAPTLGIYKIVTQHLLIRGEIESYTKFMLLDAIKCRSRRPHTAPSDLDILTFFRHIVSQTVIMHK